MGRGDLRLLSRRAHLCVEAGKRVGLVKLTVPQQPMVLQVGSCIPHDDVTALIGEGSTVSVS